MSTPPPAGSLSKAYWAEAGGAAWSDLDALMDRLNRPVGEAVAARSGAAPGDRVLDVGCGAGATTLDMARQVGPTGGCTGVDVSGALLDVARRRTAAEAVTNADFIQADAQVHDFGDGVFDGIISRYGVMFFDDPDAAFANLRRSLRPGGRLTFACWRGPDENPLSKAPLEAAAPFLPEPVSIPRQGPGRFAFADQDFVRGILDRSGWRDVAIEPLDRDTPLSLAELQTLSLRMGVLGPVLPTLPEATRAKVRQAVGERLAREARTDGVVEMTAACWLVTARR